MTLHLQLLHYTFFFITARTHTHIHTSARAHTPADRSAACCVLVMCVRHYVATGVNTAKDIKHSNTQCAEPQTAACLHQSPGETQPLCNYTTFQFEPFNVTADGTTTSCFVRGSRTAASCKCCNKLDHL